MYDNPTQPVLTSHLKQNGPSRGKRRYEVTNERRNAAPPRDRGPNKQRNSRPQAPKPSKFDHDQMIQAFKGVEITLLFLNGEGMNCKLVDGDRYALVVDGLDGREIVYKSSLQSIGLPTPKKPRGS